MKLHTLLFFALFALLLPVVNAAPEKQEAAEVRQLSLENRPWKGDFDQMLERRMIRALVPYSRTLYFNDRGRERGVAADLLRFGRDSCKICQNSI